MKMFLGGLLVAIGALIAGTTGLCTGVVLFASIGGILQRPWETLQMSPILLIGIVPCAVGVLIVRGGLVLMRDARNDRAGP